ncbi:MAG: GAF domain-containing protein [Myxococcales bacterium]|nr:GAF domain-containing protein [Myxococcales bacterium]
MSASDRRSAPEDLVAALECVKQQAAELVAENQQLQKALADSEHEDPAASVIRDEAWQEERESLQDAMQQMEQENQELADRLVAADKENSQLVNLYVASSQLHSSLEISVALNNIVEIIINLIGAERFVVYLFNEQTRAFMPVAAEGGKPSESPILSLDDEAFSNSLSSTENRFADSDSADGSRPIAWIPLVMNERPIGAIAIYSLLLQKEGFSPLDYQLFALLAESAASALCAAKLYSDTERKAQTFQGFFDLLTK